MSVRNATFSHHFRTPCLNEARPPLSLIGCFRWAWLTTAFWRWPATPFEATTFQPSDWLLSLGDANVHKPRESPLWVSVVAVEKMLDAMFTLFISVLYLALEFPPCLLPPRSLSSSRAAPGCGSIPTRWNNPVQDQQNIRAAAASSFV